MHWKLGDGSIGAGNGDLWAAVVEFGGRVWVVPRTHDGEEHTSVVAASAGDEGLVVADVHQRNPGEMPQRGWHRWNVVADVVLEEVRPVLESGVSRGDGGPQAAKVHAHLSNRGFVDVPPGRKIEVYADAERVGATQTGASLSPGEAMQVEVPLGGNWHGAAECVVVADRENRIVEVSEENNVQRCASALVVPEIFGVTIDEGSGDVVLQWNSVPAAEQYRVYRRHGEPERFELVGATANTRFRDVGALAAAPWWYRVTAVDGAGHESLPSAAVRVGALASGGSCAADCNADGSVTIDELLLAVNVALELRQAADCAAADPDGNGAVTIDEIVLAARAALEGCGPGTAPR